MWATVAFFSLSAALSIRFLAPVLRNRWTWAVITILTSLVMTSGYMFTRIRGMPMVASDGSWISNGFQSQYGQETTVVATLCTWLLRIAEQELLTLLFQMACCRLLS